MRPGSLRFIFALSLLPPAFAADPTVLTLSSAIDAALHNYPAVHVSEEQRNAAAAGLRLARTAYLPHLDSLAQFDRSTRNNIFSMSLPQTGIPALSGPVLGTNNLGSVWGSAVGLTVNWEPFDFGRRAATIAEAAATQRESEATLNRTRFEIAVHTADAYLTLLAAQETIRAAQAGVDRAASLAKITKAQVDSQLRPGADYSRATAEFAAARTQLIQTQQAADLARATLAQFTGQTPNQISIAPGTLLNLITSPAQQLPTLTNNPAVLAQAGTLQLAQLQLRTLERTYFPKFVLQGFAYARGSGAELNGSRLGGLNGLAPNVQNYALAFTVTFPLLDLPAIHAREDAQRATIRAEQAKADQLIVDLRAEWYRAVASLNAANQIAANTPIELSSARAAVEQATARYQAGLSNIAEVADAQRLLAQSEIDDSLARLNVWRSLLAVATVAGDIQPFVTEASQ